MTRKINMATHVWASTSGEKNSRSQLLDNDIREIRNSKLSVKSLAKQYRISENQIRRIITRKAWKDVL